MTKRVAVSFETSWGGYNNGEVAGFDPDQAAKLIEARVAKPFLARSAVTKDAPESESDAAEPEAEKPEAETPKAKKKKRGRPRKK